MTRLLTIECDLESQKKKRANPQHLGCLKTLVNAALPHQNMTFHRIIMNGLAGKTLCHLKCGFSSRAQGQPLNPKQKGQVHIQAWVSARPQIPPAGLIFLRK